MRAASTHGTFRGNPPSGCYDQSHGRAAPPHAPACSGKCDVHTAFAAADVGVDKRCSTAAAGFDAVAAADARRSCARCAALIRARTSGETSFALSTTVGRGRASAACARSCICSHGMAPHGVAWRGAAWHGKAQHCTACNGAARRGAARRVTACCAMADSRVCRTNAGEPWCDATSARRRFCCALLSAPRRSRTTPLSNLGNARHGFRQRGGGRCVVGEDDSAPLRALPRRRFPGSCFRLRPHAQSTEHSLRRACVLGGIGSLPHAI